MLVSDSIFCVLPYEITQQVNLTFVVDVTYPRARLLTLGLKIHEHVRMRC